MAIKVTKSIITSKGETSELYFHITEFYRTKGGKGQFPVKYYTNSSKEVECEIFPDVLKKIYKVDILDSIGVVSIEEAAYAAITAQVQSEDSTYTLEDV